MTVQQLCDCLLQHYQSTLPLMPNPLTQRHSSYRSSSIPSSSDAEGSLPSSTATEEELMTRKKRWVFYLIWLNLPHRRSKEQSSGTDESMLNPIARRISDFTWHGFDGMTIGYWAHISYFIKRRFCSALVCYVTLLWEVVKRLLVLFDSGYIGWMSSLTHKSFPALPSVIAPLTSSAFFFVEQVQTLKMDPRRLHDWFNYLTTWYG